MSVKSSGDFGAGLARAAFRYHSDGRLSQNRAYQGVQSKLPCALPFPLLVLPSA